MADAATSASPGRAAGGAHRRGKSAIGTSKEGYRLHNLAGYAFISPWLIGFFAFTLLPILASLYFSFTDYDILRAPRFVGLANFRRMFTEDVRYLTSVRVTLQYVSVAVPLRLLFALILAMFLKSARRGVALYRAAYYAPSVIGGSVAVALMWRRIFGTEGLANAITGLFGVSPITWLGDPRTAIWTLILLAVWQFGSPMLIFLAGLKQIPQELYEAASIDGASPWSKFRHITLPMLSPVILFNLVMQTISGFMVFTQAFIITGGAPMDTTLFYALYLYQRAFATFQMGYASAMAWVWLLVVAAATALVFKSSAYWVFYESR
jgi:multiple sugar transport system permease protein